MHKATLQFVFVLTPLWAGSAYAERIYPLITYQCSPKSDKMIITNSIIKDGSGANYNYSTEKGHYSPWHMIEVDPESKSGNITSKSKIKNTCTLSSGAYTIIIEPQTFGPTLSGQCAHNISAAVTINRDGVNILERTPFESYCHGNSPVISKIGLFGNNAEIKIKRVAKHKFH